MTLHAGYPSEERGSVTIVTAGIVAIVIIATLGVADVGRALIAQAHAQAAADAAALAAAQELALATGSDPSTVAADYSAQNDATMVSCVCAPGGTDAIVTVRVPVGHLLLVPGDRWVTAAARADVDLAAPTIPA